MQRFLCVDGVEVSNPSRTIAYLKAKGGHMLRGGPGQFARGSCDCSTFGPEGLCSIDVIAGQDVSSPSQFCGGLQLLTGGWEEYAGLIRVIVTGVAGDPRPPLPDPDDPGWVPGFAGPVSGPTWNCVPYSEEPPPGDQSGFQCITIMNTTTGAYFVCYLYASGLPQAFGDYAENSFSFDGVTWFEGVQSHTYSDLPCATSPDYYTTLMYARADEESFCLGIGVQSGWTGPIQQVVDFYPSPAPVGALPPDNDPGWVPADPPGGTFPYFTQAVGCWPWDGTQYVDLPDDGFYRTRYTDLSTGLTRTVYSAMNWSLVAPGDFAGSAGSFDGVTWIPYTPGWNTLTVGDPPTEGEFTTPEGDDAPWYDPGVPESADVLGVWLNTFDLSSPHKRDKRDRSWGSSLGATKYVGRELVISGVVFATNARATAYAKQWLYEALAGSCAGGPCGLPDALVYTACPDTLGGTDQLRTLKRIGLLSYDPMEPDDEFPACWGFRFEATLATETPFMYHQPVVSYAGPIVPFEQESVCNICNPCPPLPGNDPLVCGCADVPARVVPEPDPDDCWCNPVTINRVSVQMQAPHLWTDATAIIKIKAGFNTIDPDAPGLRNLRIRAWPNPVGLPGPPLGSAEGLNCVEPCMEIDVSCVPQGATLTIDGTTRTATVSNNGGTVSGWPYLSSNGGQAKFTWPEIGCYGLVIAIDSDAFPGATAEDSTIEIQMVGADRG